MLLFKSDVRSISLREHSVRADEPNTSRRRIRDLRNDQSNANSIWRYGPLVVIAQSDWVRRSCGCQQGPCPRASPRMAAAVLSAVACRNWRRSIWPPQSPSGCRGAFRSQPASAATGTELSAGLLAKKTLIRLPAGPSALGSAFHGSPGRRIPKGSADIDLWWSLGRA